MAVMPPPNPHTRTPRLGCPPGAIDSHFHIFGPAAEYPLAPDSFHLIADALPETLVDMHKVLGIGGGVLVSGGGYGRDARHMPDWVPDEAVRNRILVDNPHAPYGFGPAP